MIYARSGVPKANFTTALIVDLEADDLIEMLVYREVDFTANYDIGGENSFISILQNGGATGPRGAKGPSGGGIVDVSGVDLEIPDEDDKGTVWLDAYQHDLVFRGPAVPRHHSGVWGRDRHCRHRLHAERPSEADRQSGQVWFKPANDYVYISGTGNIWFSTQWRFSSIGTALSIPYTGYTSVEYIGQYDTADDAANSIRAADYEATTQYIWYDRNDTRIKYLSVYVAPNTQVAYWDVAHVLTDENRITPHPVADKWTGTLVVDEADGYGHRASGDRVG